jgi:hypothetical protein
MEQVFFRVKVNQLYFSRFEEVEIVMVIDEAPGALAGAALFADLDKAREVANIIGGIVVETSPGEW